MTGVRHDDALARRSREFAPRREQRVDMLRIPPQSVEAEQSVLGGLMLSAKAWPEVADLLTEEDFYRRDHQLIFRAIQEQADAGRPIDAVTLGDWFEANGQSELVAKGAYLVELASTVPSAANVRAYAQIVRDKAKLRALIGAGTDMVNAAFDPEGRESDELLSDAQGALLAIGEDRTGTGPRTMLEVGVEWFEDLQDRYANPHRERGIVTPWGTLNRLIHSMEPGHLVVVAGRPSMGKSALAVNLATSCGLREGEKRKRVLYDDLESTGRALFNRALSSITRVPLNFLRDPKAFELAQDKLGPEGIDTDSFWTRIGDGVKRLKQSGFKIDDTPGLNARQICARARREYQREPFHLLVIDHLHLIPLPGKTRETVEIGHITAALKKLAKELNITVVLLSQLNRSVESRADKRPTMADLRESGNIEQDADLIVLVYRDDYYAEREGRSSRAPGLVELIVAKQREGRTGTGYARADLSVGLLDDIDDEAVAELLAKGMALAQAQAQDDGKGGNKPAGGSRMGASRAAVQQSKVAQRPAVPA